MFLKLPLECSFSAYRVSSDYSFLFCEDLLSFVDYTFRLFLIKVLDGLNQAAEN